MTGKDRITLLRVFRVVLALFLLLNLALGIAAFTAGRNGAINLGATALLASVMGFQTFVIRRQRRIDAIADRPRPDYPAIARMERELYGKAFEHDGAPRARGLDPDVAELHAMMDDLAERATARRQRSKVPFEDDRRAMQALAARAKMRPVRYAACPEGHPNQLWVEGRGQVCPKCDREHRSNLRWERPS